MENNVSLTVPINQTVAFSAIQKAALTNDLAKLSEDERYQLLLWRCHQLGVDPASRPFQILSLYNKKTNSTVMTLYPAKELADILIAKNNLTVERTGYEVKGSVVMYFVRVTSPNGNFVDEIGVVACNANEPASLEFAILKAATKAKRRAVFSICGLSSLEPQEIDMGEIEVSVSDNAPRQMTPALDRKAAFRLLAQALGKDMAQVDEWLSTNIPAADLERHIANYEQQAAAKEAEGNIKLRSSEEPKKGETNGFTV